MWPTPPSIRDHVLALRHHAILRGNTLFFRPMPLFVILAYWLDDTAARHCIEYAIDDGRGDSDDLDPGDDRQISRLELAMLEKASSLNICELLTIHCGGWPPGLQYSLCLGQHLGVEILVIHRSDDVPSFEAFALGYAAETLECVRDHPEILVPRMQEQSDRVLEVSIHQPIDLSLDDVKRIVRALTGLAIVDCGVKRPDRLLGSELYFPAA